MPVEIRAIVDDSQKHDFDINQILYKDGKLYTAADDGKIKVWNQDLKLLQEVQAHPCSIFSITLSEDTLYTCSNDGTVKSFILNNLQEKQTLIKEEDKEFWKLCYKDDVLYIGDDQGNCRIYKNDKFFGSINFAIPVKDLTVRNNLVFASKDHDVIITDLRLTGEKPTFNLKPNIEGRGPLLIIENNIVFCSKTGRDVILNEITEKSAIREIKRVQEAHEMIINAATSVAADGHLILATGGWDKNLKLWNISNNEIKLDSCVDVNFVITALVGNDQNQIFVAGSNGNLIRVDL